MQWMDWATIALALFVGLSESRRGALTAIVDVAGIVLGLMVAETLYPEFVSEAVSPVTAYCLVFAAVMVLTVLISWQVQLATARITGPIDMGLAAGVGVIAGLCLSYALFYVAYLAYGRNYGPFADSLLRPAVYDLNWYHALSDRFIPGGGS